MPRYRALTGPRNARERVNDSVSNYASGLGSGKDPGILSRPNMLSRLYDHEIDELYAHDKLTKKGVDTIVEEALSAGITVNDKPLEEFLEDQDLEYTAEGILKRVKRTAIQARLKGIGAVLLVREMDPAQYRAPAPEDGFEKPVVAVHVLCKEHLTIIERGENILHRDFEKPVLFGVQSAYGGAMLEVHRDHLLIMEGEELPDGLRELNEGFADSIVQSAWSQIRRFLDSENAMAHIIQKFETSEMSINGLSDALLDKNEQNSLIARMELFQMTLSALNIALTDAEAGETFKRTFATVTGLEALWDRLVHSVAMAFDMPVTKLMGMSPSGQATDDASGRANWRTRLATYQTHELKPLIVSLLKALSGEEKITIAFNPLREQTAEEKARVEESYSRSALSLKQAGIFDDEELRNEAVDRGIVGKSNLNADWKPRDPAEDPGLITGNKAEPNPEGGLPDDDDDVPDSGPPDQDEDDEGSP